MERETFGSRLGFLLISAGCAIGIGNVWRFPYIVGQYGGGAFVAIYLLFLAIMGVPVLTMEFAVGRASRKSCVCAYQQLEPKGTKWHRFGPFAMVGNYILMMFYTVVCGWMLYYFWSFVSGSLEGLSTAGIADHFAGMLQSPGVMGFWMAVTVLLGMGVCSLGLEAGVERITKWMMLALLAVMVVLAVRSLSLPGGAEGLRFYLVPDLERLREVGVGKAVAAAMNQAFFTLSLGAGNMMIFGSYLKRDRSLLGESVSIAALDTFVAVVAGLIIFPACFAYGVSPDSGPRLVFLTLPNVFASMSMGRLWGGLFFLFMSFAALSTVIGVFENILACCMDLWGWSRRKACLLNLLFLLPAGMPCVLGFNVWSGVTPFGAGSNLMDLEDYLISNLLLPLGSLLILLFCTRKKGWGFDQYLAEVNQGHGWKLHPALRGYLSYVLTILLGVLLVRSILRL